MTSIRLSRPMVADRFVLFGVLVSLLAKLQLFFVGFFVYRQLPIQDDFFPAVLRSPLLFMGCYIGALLLTTLTFLSRSHRPLWILKCAIILCLSTLCVHQQSYNDVTFLTSIWAVIWSIWFGWYLTCNDESSALEAGTVFSHAILSLVFLGAAVGKLTSGYWDGTVLYHIYFESRNFWVFNLLRDNLETDQLRVAAQWYSRGVVVTELSCSLLWLFPPRIASWIAIVVLLAIALMSNFLLFSVVGGLIGLAGVGLVAKKATKKLS